MNTLSSCSFLQPASTSCSVLETFSIKGGKKKDDHAAKVRVLTGNRVSQEEALRIFQERYFSGIAKVLSISHRGTSAPKSSCNWLTNANYWISTVKKEKTETALL